MPEKNIYGFTLVEMVVVLTIIAVLIASIISIAEIYVKINQRDLTVERINEISQKIETFLLQNGRYPCPAKLTLDVSDKDFGRETNCDVSVDNSRGCSAGVCSFEGYKETNAGDQPSKVRLGAVPVKDLGLANEYVEDGYGTRYLYAVSEKIASKKHFADISNNIKILGSQRQPHQLAAFLLLSHGEDGKGGFSQTGTKNNRCQNQDLDAENCDYDDAVFIESDLTTNAGPNFFDDFIFYTRTHPLPKWHPLDQSNGNLINRDYSNSSVSIGAMEIAKDLKSNIKVEQKMVGDEAFVIINGEEFQVDPCASYKIINNGGALELEIENENACEEGEASVNLAFLPKIEIHGNVGSEAASAEAFCNENLEGCFISDMIGGEGIGCAENEYMQGIREGKADCDSAIICEENGTFLLGFEEITGLPICAELPVNCSSQEIQVCGNAFVLPGTQVYKEYILKSGFSRAERFACEFDQWRRKSSSGSCECEETSDEIRKDCPFGFEGEILELREFVCQSDTQGETTVTELENTCVCDPQSQTNEFPCTQGYDGYLLKQRDFMCPDAEWSQWRLVQDNCVRATD